MRRVFLAFAGPAAARTGFAPARSTPPDIDALSRHKSRRS